MWVQVKDLAKREGVCRQTIHKRIKDGHYEKVQQTKGGHFRIWVETKPIYILYARVLTSKQKSSIESQKELLLAKYPSEEFVYDIGSGFNFERRGFKAILERAINGVPQIIVVTTSDRLTRTGFPLIKRLIELSGGRIEILEEEPETEEFDTKSFISFITSFVNSYYGKRAAKRKNYRSHEKNTNISTK